MTLIWLHLGADLALVGKQAVAVESCPARYVDDARDDWKSNGKSEEFSGQVVCERQSASKGIHVTRAEMTAPSWLSLLAAIPADAKPARKPVASAEQLATGTAGPIAGWQSVIIDLSEPSIGLRHVQITLDENGDLLSGGDYVMFVRETGPNECDAKLTEHINIGGRFEKDGSFRGTHWHTLLETDPNDDEKSTTKHAHHRAPSEDEVAALRRIIADVLRRDAQP